MIIVYFLLIPTVYVFAKTIIYFIVRKFGKLSYDGFSAAGFIYNSEKNVFYSAKNAWQKNFGYCHLYDVCAPILHMIIDTEPVKFYYNKRNWLIVFWKGQYGITTGGEVGVYSTNQQKINKKTIYMPSDDELLDMMLDFIPSSIGLKDMVISKLEEFASSLYSITPNNSKTYSIKLYGENDAIYKVNIDLAGDYSIDLNYEYNDNKNSIELTLLESDSQDGYSIEMIKDTSDVTEKVTLNFNVITSSDIIGKISLSEELVVSRK